MYRDCPLLSGEAIGEICILTFKDMPLLHVTGLETKEVLFDYLELLSFHDTIKVLLIRSAPVKRERDEYIEFYQNQNFELGVIPTGGSVFFLSKLLGFVATSKLLLSGQDISAVQAQELGIVDKVVPLAEFDRLAVQKTNSTLLIIHFCRVGSSGKQIIFVSIFRQACQVIFKNSTQIRLENLVGVAESAAP